MRMYEIIEKKRDKEELSTEEINYFIKEYVEGKIQDYQAAALLMAIYLNGMNKRETADLTMAMAKSGDMIDLSGVRGIKVDKHSTGGVGDKATLVVGPLAAAAGVPVAKMSGRGLGHTGGTVDKIEAIPGFQIYIDRETFINNVNVFGLALAGQTGNLVPADKKIYALRDVTATVGSIPLIASSIMSKKIAAGSDAIVLDIKTGNGAFMKNRYDAIELAKEMVDIGTNVGRNTVAIISDMDEPLGHNIGNSLEVIESIETLKGNGPKDIEELCLIIAGFMIYLGGKADTPEQGREIAREKLVNGEGLEKLKEMIRFQGGNINVIDDYSLFSQADIKHEVNSNSDGFIGTMNTEQIGISSVVLGAGRETKESSIDYSVGIILNKKVGDHVKIGEKIATIYANDEIKLKECEKIFMNAIKISVEPVNKPKLILGVVTKDGIQRF